MWITSMGAIGRLIDSEKRSDYRILKAKTKHNLICGKGRDGFSREPSGNQVSTNVFGFYQSVRCTFCSLRLVNLAEVEKATKNATGKTLWLVVGKAQLLQCQSGHISILQ